MSTKKIYTSIGIAEEVNASLRQAMADRNRSLSYIVEEALRKYFAISRERGKEGTNANATKAN